MSKLCTDVFLRERLNVSKTDAFKFDWMFGMPIHYKASKQSDMVFGYIHDYDESCTEPFCIEASGSLFWATVDEIAYCMSAGLKGVGETVSLDDVPRIVYTYGCKMISGKDDRQGDLAVDYIVPFNTPCARDTKSIIIQPQTMFRGLKSIRYYAGKDRARYAEKDQAGCSPVQKGGCQPTEDSEDDEPLSKRSKRMQEHRQRTKTPITEDEWTAWSQAILLRIKGFGPANVFLTPFDYAAYNLPGVKQGLDLSTVEQKLMSHHYMDREAFDADMRGVLSPILQHASPETRTFAIVNYCNIALEYLWSCRHGPLPEI